MITNIQRKIEELADEYYRLILIAAPSGSGKTRLLRNFGEVTGTEILNVNLECSKALLELSRRQRMRKSARILEEIIGSRYAEGETVLF